MEPDGGIPIRSGLQLFRKASHRKSPLRSYPADSPRWTRRFFCPRRRRPKEHNLDVQPNQTLAEPLQLPAALRTQIVELLAQALIDDYRAHPTMPA